MDRISILDSHCFDGLRGMDLRYGKMALVTRDPRGSGRASALVLAKAKPHVIVHYGRGTSEAEGVVAEIREAGGRADLAAADLAAIDGPHQLDGGTNTYSVRRMGWNAEKPSSARAPRAVV